MRWLLHARAHWCAVCLVLCAGVAAGRRVVEKPKFPRAVGAKAGSVGAPAQALPAGGAEEREAICARLMEHPRMYHTDPLFMHGRAYVGPRVDPRCTWRSWAPPRDDHAAPDWLTASEFQDEAEVMKAKVQQLARLMRLSRKTVLYTGAGISASIIGQAARSGVNEVGWKPNTRQAKPTLTHYILSFLGRHGLVQSWVQQNHDGLPQKAGFPQEHINEIHGSWFDPSNPVVKYSGNLGVAHVRRLQDDAASADLVIVIGTSLSGLNADRVATLAAHRSKGPDGALGTVCINMQQTQQDEVMTLRLFGKSDDVLLALLSELGFGRPNFAAPVWPPESRALVPYNAHGRRIDKGARMLLDLRDGQLIRLTPGHNIQGARQPQYLHIGALAPVAHEGVLRQPGLGLGHVEEREEDAASFRLTVDGALMRLGIWWLEAASRGALEVLPIVNQHPEFES